ncbi:MAG TPA: phage tail protein [Propylenella sp.]|nr:phage tail protein [Propylenella sp.]
MLQAFRTDAADADDRVLFRGRNRLGDLTVAAEALVEPAEEPNLTRSRAQETELASEIVLRVIDPAKDYRMAAASSRRLAGQSRRSATLDLTAVLDFAEAERLTELLLRDIWTGRERVEFRLPPSALAVEPGDMVSLTGGTRPEFLLAERIEDAGSRRVQLRRVDESGGPPPLKPPRRNPPATVPAWGPPAVRIVDFAPPDGSEAHAPRLALSADPWPGRVAVYSGAEGGGFRLAATVSAPATLGRLDSALAPGPLGVFDQGNAIEVTLFGGTLAGLPDTDVLSGGNAAAVQTAGGAWEILQFAHAELIGANRYRLTRLLRGQCGTEQAMSAGAAAGADFVLLNAAVVPLPVGPDQIGLPLRYRFGPARDSHAAPSFAELTIVAAGAGLKPFAPVHLQARRDAASGDVTISWIRRSRFGGVSWELAEVPLNEEREAYRLEILHGGVVKRRIELASPTYFYSAVDQAADFGGPATVFTAKIAQLSAMAGPGFGLVETVDV